MLAAATARNGTKRCTIGGALCQQNLSTIIDAFWVDYIVTYLS